MASPAWPFVGTEALANGIVTGYQLRTRYDAVFRNVYVPTGQPLTPFEKAVAAWLWSGRQATVAGISAAALHGSLWIDAHLPAELNRASLDKTDGIVLHSDKFVGRRNLSTAGHSRHHASAHRFRSGTPTWSDAGRHSPRRTHAGHHVEARRHRGAQRAPPWVAGCRAVARSDRPGRCRRRIASRDPHPPGADVRGSTTTANTDRSIRPFQKSRWPHRHGLG